MRDIWVSIDTKTHRIVDFGGQDACQLSANEHSKLSGNETVIRTLKIGMVLEHY